MQQKKNKLLHSGHEDSVHFYSRANYFESKKNQNFVVMPSVDF